MASSISSRSLRSVSTSVSVVVNSLTARASSRVAWNSASASRPSTSRVSIFYLVSGAGLGSGAGARRFRSERIPLSSPTRTPPLRTTTLGTCVATWATDAPSLLAAWPSPTAGKNEMRNPSRKVIRYSGAVRCRHVSPPISPVGAFRHRRAIDERLHRPGLGIFPLRRLARAAGILGAELRRRGRLRALEEIGRRRAQIPAVLRRLREPEHVARPRDDGGLRVALIRAQIVLVGHGDVHALVARAFLHGRGAFLLRHHAPPRRNQSGRFTNSINPTEARRPGHDGRK